MNGTSVIIRAKDEAASIGRTLDLLAAQSRPPDEVIVVDSGSADATPVLAAERGARVIGIPAETFTFGGALNTGCAAASAEVIVALSAHAFPTDPGWLERISAAMDGDDVACACGQVYGPDGDSLRGPVRQDAALARRQPTWGYTNSAGAFRADLWRDYPFREDMPGTEDKDWALHWLDEGWACLVDPALLVDHDHSKDSLREQFERARRERIGYLMMLGDTAAFGPRDLLREWWSERESYGSVWRARLSHRRGARLLGDYAARRQMQNARASTARREP